MTYPPRPDPWPNTTALPTTPHRRSSARLPLLIAGILAALCLCSGLIGFTLVNLGQSAPDGRRSSADGPPAASPSVISSSPAPSIAAAMGLPTPSPQPAVLPASPSRRATAQASPRPRASSPKPKPTCDPNYADACVPIASDVDCGGGSGNGPAYFYGVARVVGSDIYDLDRDNDGYACEKG